MKEFFFLIFFILIGCQPKSEHSSIELDTPLEEGTKIFGDTLKIEYEYHGDTVIQYRTDLKGISDDGFDNSFTVTSIWSTQKSISLNCEKKLKLTQESIDFFFCIDDVIQKIKTDINNLDEPQLKETLNRLDHELAAIKAGKLEMLSMDSYFLTFDLLRTINFSAIQKNERKMIIDKVRIEQYETEFSGGYNYYLITKGDTIARFDVNEWIR